MDHCNSLEYEVSGTSSISKKKCNEINYPYLDKVKISAIILDIIIKIVSIG